MASDDSGEIAASEGVKAGSLGQGPFVLRSLIKDLPLSADGDREDIEINCVEYLGKDNDDQ